ncbi:MAG: alpha-galactosidase [Clostridia bacterium]|nr:alpha-galactosidase [Clostridia bacterium]
MKQQKHPFSLCISRKNIFCAIPRKGMNIYRPSNSITVLIDENRDGFVYRKMTVSNESENESEQISAPLILDTALECKTSVIIRSLRGEDCSKYSFLPVESRLSEGDSLIFEPTGGRSSSTTAFPVFEVECDGKTFIFIIGWTGQWRVSFKKEHEKLKIQAGIRYADFFLYPKESVTLPSVMYVCGDDARLTRQLFRRVLINRMAPENLTSLPIAIQPFDRYYYGKNPEWQTESGQLKTLAAAEKCRGFDVFWIDAAWFDGGFPTGVGNYRFAAGFPQGVKKISDAVHKAGMRFVLWFEPERAYKNSDTYLSHPEFLLISESSARLVDLGNDDALYFVFNEVSKIIEENGVDIYRQDFNIDPLPFWLENDEVGRHGIKEIKHINGLYKLWDMLLKRFPHLLIDNCSSGGRRIDLETLRRSVVLWRSDVACFEPSEKYPTDVINQNQTLALSGYIPFQSSAAWVDKAYYVRSSMTQGLACAFDILSPDVDCERIYRLLNEIRRLQKYWKGDFYPLTSPTLSEDNFCAYELSLGESGFAAIFRRGECEKDTYRLTLENIDIFSLYSVSVSDETLEISYFEVSGKELSCGFDVKIKNKKESAVVEFKRISDSR